MMKTAGLLSLSILSLVLALPVAVVAQAEKKTAYGVLIDNTGSLRSQLPDVLALGEAVVGRVHGRGPVSLFSFATSGEEAALAAGPSRSRDEGALRGHIRSLSTVRGQTALVDAVRSMAEDLKTKAAAGGDAEKVIILITDGWDSQYPRAAQPGYQRNPHDDKGRNKLKALIRLLRDEGVKVYAVGLTQELLGDSLFRMGDRETAETFLKKLAKETGGRAVFPRTKKLDVEGVLNELLPR